MADSRREKMTQNSKCEFYSPTNSDLNRDVTFLVGPDEAKIKAKILLMVTSPVFETMYGTTGSTTKGQNVPIKLPNTDPVTFRLFLSLLLTDDITTRNIEELKLPMGQVLQLFFLSKGLLLRSLQDTLEEHIRQNLSVENVLEIYEKIHDQDEEKLETEIFSFLAKNTDSVLQQDYFLTISKDFLLKILANNTLCVDEMKLFNATYRWAKSHTARDHTLQNDDSKKEEVVQILREFLPEIRLPHITARDLAIEIVPTQLLTIEETCALFVYSQLTGEERTSRHGPMLELSSSLSMRTEARHPPLQRLLLSHQISKPGYTCTGSENWISFKANKTVKIMALGFCGPLQGDSEYEVGIRFKNVHTGVSTVEERQLIFAKEKTTFYFSLTTPLILEIDVWYTMCFKLKGAPTGNTVSPGRKLEKVTQDGIEFQWRLNFRQIPEIQYALQPSSSAL